MGHSPRGVDGKARRRENHQFSSYPEIAPANRQSLQRAPATSPPTVRTLRRRNDALYTCNGALPNHTPKFRALATKTHDLRALMTHLSILVVSPMLQRLKASDQCHRESTAIKLEGSKRGRSRSPRGNAYSLILAETIGRRCTQLFRKASTDGNSDESAMQGTPGTPLLCPPIFAPWRRVDDTREAPWEERRVAHGVESTTRGATS